MPKGIVYILANKRNGTLYIDITSDIFRRMQEHRESRDSKFAARYGVTRLVYLEEYSLYTDRILESVTLDGRVKPGHGG